MPYTIYTNYVTVVKVKDVKRFALFLCQVYGIDRETALKSARLSAEKDLPMNLSSDINDERCDELRFRLDGIADITVERLGTVIETEEDRADKVLNSLAELNDETRLKIMSLITHLQNETVDADYIMEKLNILSTQGIVA